MKGLKMKTNQKLNEALKAVLAHEWERANKILDGFGIEYVSFRDKELKYINLGDTYIDTVCQVVEYGHKPISPQFITSWGNWYESVEQDYCEENNAARCGYCSAFTPNDKENWHEIVCESCGNLVAG
jgi:hypothetical protein